MKKPELVTTAGSLYELERVFQAGADALTIGYRHFSLRMPGSFDLDEIKEAVNIAHSYNGKIYIALNALLHQDQLSDLDESIARLSQLSIDSIIFGDPAVYVSAKKVNSLIDLHWNTETTTTNYQMINFWAKKGITRAVVARELSLEAILETQRKAQAEIQAQIHGLTCIFHSKRELVKSYLNYKGKTHYLSGIAENQLMKEDMKYIEEQGKAGRYPIFEDEQGTHVMSHEDICMIMHLHEFIKGNVQSLKIDGLLKSVDYQEEAVNIYRQAIDELCNHPNRQPDIGWLEALKSIQPKNQPLGTGFYFREQIY